MVTAPLLALVLAVAPHRAPGLQAARPPQRPTVAWQGPVIDVPLGAAVLALAWLEENRLLTVSSDAVTVLALAGDQAHETARRPLPRPWPVRAPGALVSCDTRSACWVLTSHMTEAALFSTDGDALLEIARAEVLPWPGARAGVRFRAGTNLVEAVVAGLPDGPYAHLGGGAEPFAVSPDGTLGLPGRGWTDVAAGQAAAPLWPGALLLSSRGPPGARDALRVVSTFADPPRQEEGELAVDGAVRAVAAAPAPEGARVAVVIEDHTAAFRLRVHHLRPPARR